MTPEEAITGVLAAALVDLSLGNNLFKGPVRVFSPGKIPHQAVFCLETGGPPPEMCVKGNEGPDIRFSSVQVRVRSNPRSYSTGKTLAEQAWKALQRAVSAGYLSITVRESSPVYLGENDTEHHEWALNIETIRED